MKNIVLGHAIIFQPVEQFRKYHFPWIFRYPSNQIIMCNAIGISMNTSQFSVHVCLKYDRFLSKYGWYSFNSKCMGPYRRASASLFLKRYIFLKEMFVDALSPKVMKRKPSIFWWNQLKHHNNFLIVIIYIQCFDNILYFLENTHFLLNL